MTVTLDSLKDNTITGRKRLAISLIAMSVAIHLLAGICAGIWIVSKYFAPKEATFEVKKIAIPPKIIDPKMASAELQAAAPKPILDRKLASLREVTFALPDLPKTDVAEMLEFDPAAMVMDQMEGLLAGLGANSGGDGAGGGGAVGMSFFGINAQGRSVVVIFDVSLSVLNKAKKAGISIDRIKQETLALIEGLSINTVFDLFQFSRYYQPFAGRLVAPTEANKAAVKAWLEKDFQSDGSLGRNDVKGVIAPSSGEDNGIVFVLQAALKARPDVIFLISDASFQSERYAGQVPWDEVEDVIKRHEKSGSVAPKINFIGFQMKEDDGKAMKKIVRKTAGTLRELE